MFVRPNREGARQGSAEALVLLAALFLAGCNRAATVTAGAPVTPQTPPPSSPVLQLSSSTLGFAATAGGPSPAARSVTATNAGGGSLAAPTASVSYGAGTGWLRVSVSGAAAPYTIAVQPDVTGLAAGDYAATVQVASAGASGSPQPLAVSLSVTPAPAGPVLQLSASTLSFAATAGGPSPAARSVTATNAGGGSLAAPTASVDYGSGTTGWLRASVSGAAAPYTIAVQPDVAGLAAGDYAATVQVASAGASGSPQPLAVSLSVAASGGWWKPAPGTSWQWQLQGTLDTSFDVVMYDVDLFGTSAAQIAALRKAGRRVICYYSAGTYEPGRPDSASLQPYRGNAVAGWPGEYWLDYRQQGVLDVMSARLDLAATKGCDGVEPDNVDAYTNNPGFGGGLTAATQLEYNRWTAAAAHARGLSVGLKNDLDQVAALMNSYDWALNEECFAYSECDLLMPFIAAGKAVFQTEYTSANPATQAQIDAKTAAVCAISPNGPNTRNFDAIVKDLDLDALRGACR